ncbi:MAG: hydrogen peroxide-inducible genes activator [Oligoflexia bacterium]|nr:hydrogen peroxide-inducible genes activator [Oligoflexia bacterium]
MTLTQLEYILAVDEYRSFSKAAKANSVTQPSLSMQLQKLEEELGIIIFDRSKNPIIPTLEGEDILKQARLVIKESQKITTILEEKKRILTGDFKLAVIPTISPYLIPLFVNKITEKHSKLRLTIEEHKTEDILKYLDEDKIDAAIMATPLYQDNLIERVLYYEPFCVFVSPEHRLSTKSKINPADLNVDEIWPLNKGNCFRDQVINICSSEESKNKKLKDKRISYESGSFDTLKNMVLKCGGITILPWLLIQDLPEKMQKEYVKNFIKPIPTREISIVYARSFHKERIINSLEEEIINALPAGVKALKKNNASIDIIDFTNDTDHEE